MKNLFISVSILLASLLVNVTYAESSTLSHEMASTQKTATFTINKMTCKMCHITVRKAMEKVDGVITASVDYDSKTATVAFDSAKTTTDAIALASTNIGYPAVLKATN
ncbi:MAG: cation transporter [Colwellia sp.]|nr:cation transporter [Colwellia sp.]